MIVLINTSNLKKGGGQNVALNFLHGLFEINDNKNIYYFLVVENSPIHQFLKQKKQQNILTTSSSPGKRVFLEFFKFSSVFKKLNIDIIYTYFGYGLFKCRIPQVCGVAISNVFFPEIKFWQGGFFNVFIRKMIDKYRIYGIKKANALIFENKIMEERSHSLFRISPKSTIYIPPSFNPYFEQKELNLQELKQKTTKVLMLCEWQRNKNVMKVPEIASYIKKTNLDFQFIVTAPEDFSKEHKEFLKLIDKYGVKEMISIIGPVPKEKLSSLYSQIDIVLLMSKLESFSNNIIEAWYFKKPLAIHKAQWSKEICKDSAFYIDRNSPPDIAESLLKLKNSQSIQNELIRNGLKQLKNYPSIKEKIIMELSFIEKIYYEFTKTS